MLIFCHSVPVSVVGLTLNETCLKEGGSISIRCNIRGFPRPSVKFSKNNVEVTPGEGMFQNIQLEFYDQARKKIIGSDHFPQILICKLEILMCSMAT